MLLLFSFRVRDRLRVKCPQDRLHTMYYVYVYYVPFFVGYWVLTTGYCPVWSCRLQAFGWDVGTYMYCANIHTCTCSMMYQSQVQQSAQTG